MILWVTVWLCSVRHKYASNKVKTNKKKDSFNGWQVKIFIYSFFFHTPLVGVAKTIYLSNYKIFIITVCSHVVPNLFDFHSFEDIWMFQLFLSVGSKTTVRGHLVSHPYKILRNKITTIFFVCFIWFWKWLYDYVLFATNMLEKKNANDSFTAGKGSYLINQLIMSVSVLA